ncbi:MAG TPA: sialate O-acetylesterase [Pirellulales bacterium]|jgi:sialate O-acetylesterase|nr:sialate O-acetylesterase [Pirellulales bacterium]
MPTRCFVPHRVVAVVFATAIGLVLGGRCLADVKLPAIIGSNMVLQEGKKLPIWGKADAGEEVTVTLGSQRQSARAGADGKWTVTLNPVSRSSDTVEMTIAGKNTIKLTNILIGEVWVCSGQSNMGWTVSNSNNAQEEIAAAKHPKMRLFTVKQRISLEPLEDCEGSWAECSPENVGSFTAVGYFFGRDLHKDLGVPVGLINTSWGGTPAEAWTSPSTLQAMEQLKPIYDRGQQALADLPKATERHQQTLAKWKEQVAQARKDQTQPPRQPSAPMGPQNPHFPGGLYHAMIVPIVPLAIEGAIWYQGESNAGRAYQYRTLLPAMIADWRKAWNEGDFPFLVVQLANFKPVQPEPGDSEWAELREAQTMTSKLPNCGLALAIDIGEAGDIHPRNKQEVGRRLALAAESIAYHKSVDYSGPMFEAMKIEGSTVRISFAHAKGLHAKGGEKLDGFAIAGADKKFVWADARIEGNTVVVSSDKVAQPVAVRYAWADNPVCNLYNGAGLPTVPFRTDDWSGVTADKL